MGKSVKLGQMPNAPAFSASRTTTQSFASGYWTKVQCATEAFDTASAYDATTNHRFQPQIAGYYQVNASVYVTGTAMLNVGAQIYKNGAADKLGSFGAAESTQTQGAASVSGLIYLNGSTDYIELFGYTNATSPAFAGGANLNHFEACLVRPA